MKTNVYEIVYENFSKSIIVIAENLDDAIDIWYGSVNNEGLSKKDMLYWLDSVTLIGRKNDNIILTFKHWKPFDWERFERIVKTAMTSDK
jgi:hypothetical protein